MTAKRKRAPVVAAPGSPWLTTDEAAKRLRVKPGTLSNWRVAGRGPLYSDKTGRPLYHVDELDKWVAAGLRSSTTEPPHDDAQARA